MRTFSKSFCVGILTSLALGCGGPKELTGGGPDGGTSEALVCENNFCVSKMLALPVVGGRDEPSKAIAVAATPDDRIGVAYFSQTGTEDYEIRYLEWQNGSVLHNEVIRTVKRVFGVTLAFQSNGQPAVAFLGGVNDVGSVFWTESDAELAYRQPDGTWSSQIVVRKGDEAIAGNPVSDASNSFLVGLFPALGFAGSTAFLGYRDCHFGQSTTDYAKSDIEMASGGPTSWNKQVAVVGGNSLEAYGGHLQLAMANGQPALVSDGMTQADSSAQNVYFTKRSSSGSFTAVKKILTLGATGTGPSIAYDSTVGFAVAAVDRSQNALFFTSSTDGATWSAPYTVHQIGTGGWYPSIAVEPTYHDVNIAYFICSRRTGVPDDSCSPEDLELRIAQRVEGVWSTLTVAKKEAFMPKLLFLSTGRRAIVFQSLRTGALQVAVEQ